MSPRFARGRENVPCVAEVVNRSLKKLIVQTLHISGKKRKTEKNATFLGIVGHICQEK